MFNVWAWVAWLVAASVPAFTLRNPLYSVLVLGAAWLVYATLGKSSPMGSSWGAFLKIGLFFFALAIPFNALSIHIGQIILFRLPSGWPVIGGPITLEAVVAGLVSGLALFTIVVVFAAFNSVVDHYQLLRATPGFLFQAGVIISIAITFVPQMVLSAREIRQAQRIRGHRFRGIRDLLPLIIPLLANGLERAIQLAETMEARGFGGAVSPMSRKQAAYSQLGTLMGLLAVLAGLFVVTYYPAQRLQGWALVVLGIAGLAAVFGFQGRRVHRTRYSRPKWHPRDTAVVAISTIVVTVVLAAKAAIPEALVYTPYPPSPLLPPFNPLVGAALLLLVLPAILAPQPAKRGAAMTEEPVGNMEQVP
jgi:energy-coupling factor transport system permease protein